MPYAVNSSLLGILNMFNLLPEHSLDCDPLCDRLCDDKTPAPPFYPEPDCCMTPPFSCPDNVICGWKGVSDFMSGAISEPCDPVCDPGCDAGDDKMANGRDV